MTARDALFVDPAGPGENAPGTDAADARLALSGLVQTTGTSPLAVQRGVFVGHPDSLKVVPGSGMTVVVRPGVAVIPRNDATGPYLMSNDSNSTVQLSTANPSYPRIDLIYMRQQDVGQGDATTSATFGVVTGTPSASPFAPSAMPPGSMELATVRVNPGATAVTTGSISVPAGWRPWTVARGGITPVRDYTSLPSIPYIGMACFVESSGTLCIWTGVKWNVFTDGFGSWTAWTPVLQTVAGQNVTFGGGAQGDCWYKWNGATCHIQATMFFGSSGADGRSGSILFQMPPGITTVGFVEQSLSAKISIPGYGALLGEAHMPPGAQWMTLAFPTSRTDAALQPLRSCILDAQGSPQPGTGIPTVPGSYPILNGTKLFVWGTVNTAQPPVVGGRFSIYS